MSHKMNLAMHLKVSLKINRQRNRKINRKKSIHRFGGICKFIILTSIFWSGYISNSTPAQDLKPNDSFKTGKSTEKNEPLNQTQVRDEKPTEFEQLLDKELGTDKEKQNTKDNDSTSWVFQVIKTILGLFFVIVIILVLRKFLSYKSKFTINDNQIIKTLHEYPVESGKKMQIIEVANKLFLIGVSDAGIQLITEFKEQVIIDQIKLTCEAHGRAERPDLWLDLTNVITDKVQNIFKKDKKMEYDERPKWENLQSNARSKVNELREKKKFFEDMDDSHEN